MPLALVTGANRGLGLETARTLRELGWDVIATARDADAGRKAADSLGARFVQLDVADATSVGAAARELRDVAAFDALVNNAGTSLDGFNAEVAERTIEANFRGAVRVTDTFRERLAPFANIVMVSSGMGELSAVSSELRRRLLAPGLTREELERLVELFLEKVRAGERDLGGWPRSAYRVSKAAMNAFTRILAAELPEGQKVNAICPGWVRTRMGGAGASRTVAQGARGIVWAATLPQGGPSGGFFRDEKRIDW